MQTEKFSNRKVRIGVIFGGRSSEKEVSLATGRYVFHLLDLSRFEGMALFMDKEGMLWEIPEKLVILNKTDDIEAKLQQEGKEIRFEDLPGMVDLIFIALLGKYGEDGSIQGILELIGVVYTGSDVLASAVCMNKKMHKRILADSGFLVPKDIAVGKNEWEKGKEEIESRVEKEIGFPCVVKPVCEGSSVGVAVPKKGEELLKAIENAFFWDPEVLIEEYIQGKEFMCVVWGNENPQAMLPTEVEFSGDFHTYESKYMPGKARYYTPIRVSDAVVRAVQRQAVEIANLMGIVGYGRIDGYVVGEKVYIGEPHTGTIMVPSSYVFQQAAKQKVELKSQAGGKVRVTLNPKMLVTRIIEMAQEAHQGKMRIL
ncbi:hypothetical protein COS81_00090 [candidate division WWE3 bacterium CG06_land_8_20_14_3_00_42_16]|uniref:D-alanine--D-alanine ligase n=3 Tax=Katanobacteria TaxID=422282 RepID=A0A2M7APS4_UNCKA|nr:MAG: hypothetical protein AUJ38_03690 [bacterium CG1_02_42_9]PIU69374.1 MAG: hypothetical protein COS81_00090 [candidate division WWE3 bacterium CG06_land_8_20_14_3_00_42_16]PIZ41838.1 MAG: hypothetical protein COY34_03850 [candidate division WWE3 bacterium CG_4_10_14_0_2_um_filter_42_8]PJA38023.1 MAG: hypothetical protein CO181_01380 [candidate division WWE3 bacterium CG_4_9_14_3_um_filter_43_9]